jgi:hypothetical protein
MARLLTANRAVFRTIDAVQSETLRVERQP